jgi:photosystem II stability/assembly factor-like uncharacterized protein
MRGAGNGSSRFFVQGFSASVSARFLLLLMAAVLAVPAAQAHDPSAWGGIYRSRDNGATWFPADAGLFIGGAIALAIDPRDANHLLYGTDTRLLRSKNGGRDWAQEPGPQFAGAVYATMFDARSGTALASTSNRIFVQGRDGAWNAAQAPGGAAPVRAFAAGARGLYLAGGSGVFTSEDDGANWARAGESLPEGAVSALVVVPGAQERVLVVSQGRLWSSDDGGANWKPRDTGSGGAIEALARDGELFAASQNRIYRSIDGEAWAPVGQALPEAGTAIRGIAAADGGRTIVLTTHRGAMRSTDGGGTWVILEGALPVHLEAGPLVRDPTDGATLYAGFSLTPYDEIWRRASGGANLLAQLDPVSLAGGLAFLVLIAVGSAFGVRWLNRARA